MKRDFFRKVGFGIAPGESVPDDPLAWAQAQMDTVPDLSWKGDIPSSEALMDHYAHWIYTDQKVLRKKHKKTERPIKRQRTSCATKRVCVSSKISNWPFAMTQR
jgi:hypothetical protein